MPKKDANQLAKYIVDIATGEETEKDPNSGKNLAAVALGRLGGLKGGKARAKKMTKEQRKEIARQLTIINVYMTMSLENTVKQALKKEEAKREKKPAFHEKTAFFVKMKKSGLLTPQRYGIQPLDTIGRRRYQTSAKRGL